MSTTCQETDVLFTPSPDFIRTTQMFKFMQHIETVTGLSFEADYEKLHAWSVTDPASFWYHSWQFLNLPGDPGMKPHLINSHDMEKAQFFPQGEINFAQACLDHSASDSDVGIIFGCEDNPDQQFTYGWLRSRTALFMTAFKAHDLHPGDRVCAMASNTADTIAAMLAVTGLGGVWSSVSPDFGTVGVLERFAQLEPKIFLAEHRYPLKGGWVDVRAVGEEVRDSLGCIGVWFDQEGIVSEVMMSLDRFLSNPSRPLTFHPTTFNSPCFILFSSGTTGKPKCIIHRHGVILQLAKEHVLHSMISPGSKVYYYTTVTWMMWHWLISSLASRATVLLYEGSVFYPRPTITLEFACRNHAEFFGTSAKFIDALSKGGHGGDCREVTRRGSIKVVGSTGSVLSREGFEWIWENLWSHDEADGSFFSIHSISGGTDILSCFILGCPIKPLIKGKIQCRGLGMDVRVFEEVGEADSPLSTGRELPRGSKGELVCCTPFVSQPIGFLGHFGDTAATPYSSSSSLPLNPHSYHSAYFSHFRNIWRHGDFVQLFESGDLQIFGRSDATLKPGGVRVGTSEIYRTVESLPWVKEAVCVGMEESMAMRWLGSPSPKSSSDEVIALFVVLNDSATCELTPKQRETIRTTIINCCTRHHAPKVIEAVHDIPRTRNGKIAELAVKAILQGKVASSALVNPDSLKEYTRFRG